MPLRIMDCTLRDGSYAVNFNFDSMYTSELAGELDALGFPLIEIGHGAGIGASVKLKKAAATDLEYAQAVKNVVSVGKWGMFAIPGIADSNEAIALIDEGMGFIRVGIDVDDMDSGQKFLEEVSSSGIEIFVNFMKSYALPPEELYRRSMLLLKNHQISGIYLVDSAGGMMPDEIRRYADSLEPLLKYTSLGFHGHDNLGLAVYNSIYLAQRGFELIDSTLQGLGRSSGNAPSERIIAAFQKLGLLSDWDLVSILKASDKFVRPKIPNAGHSGLDTLAGYTLFHTSYMERLLTAAKEFKADPFLLMQRICDIDIARMTDDNLFESAKALNALGLIIDSPFPIDYYPGDEQS